MPGKSKYGSVRVRTVDGIEHDSKKEAARWQELNLMLRARLIEDLQRQVRFELIPKQDGERACTYIADFVYIDRKTGEKVVEDVKSPATRTEAYRIKRKLMLLVHGIRIREI